MCFFQAATRLGTPRYRSPPGGFGVEMNDQLGFDLRSDRPSRTSLSLCRPTTQPRFYLRTEPQQWTVRTKVYDGPRHVRVTTLVGAHGVAVGKAEEVGDLLRIDQVLRADIGHMKSVQVYTKRGGPGVLRTPRAWPVPIGRSDMKNATATEQLLLRGTAPAVVTNGEYTPITDGAASTLLAMLRAAQARHEVPVSPALAA